MPGGAYGRFARYYDAVYRGIVDYKGDCDYLEFLFRHVLRRRPESILDIGCGTGNHAIELARRGYEVVGLDLSRSQLQVAREKARGKRLPVTFVQGNMRRFNLRRPFDAAICMFGGFGYLLPDQDVLSHFAAVRQHLVPDGLYAFEFWQESGVIPGHRGWIVRERPIRIIRLDGSEHDALRHRVTMTFRFFVFDGSRLREQFKEIHTVRVYSAREIRKMLGKSGMALTGAHGGTRTTTRRVRRTDFRITAVARPVPKLRAH